MTVAEKYNLTDKQYKFCNEYLKDFNGKQAAIRAGYSENSAAESASENLTKSNVCAYLTEKQEKAAQRMEITLDKVLKEYSKIGFFDIRKCYNDNGELLPIADLDDDTAGGIAGIEVYEESAKAGEETFKQGTTKKIKVSDKRSALDSICKVLGFNAPEKSEIDLNVSEIPTSTLDRLIIKYGPDSPQVSKYKESHPSNG